MGFEVYGPFNLCDRRGVWVESSKRGQADFWTEVDSRRGGLKDSFGCYLFALLHRGTSMPWYVGRAVDEPFLDACFSLAAKRSYRKASREHPGATPQLLLLPFQHSGIMVRPLASQRADVRWMSAYLSALCLNRNPALIEAAGFRHRRYAEAAGVVQMPSRPTIDHRAFRSVLGLS